MGAALIHADRRTDRMKDMKNVIGAFNDCGNAPKICIQLGNLCPFADNIYEAGIFIVVKI